MRPILPRHRSVATWIAVAVALFLAWQSQRNAAPSDPPLPPTPFRADFDFYLLALTSHPAFCADGHAREPECQATPAVPLSIHGLWPEKLAAGRYPRDCPGPGLSLQPELARELRVLMPGMADALHEHEWRKHGRCSGLDDDQYFRSTLDLSRRLDALLSDRLSALAGGETSARELREFIEQRAPGLGATLTFHCRTLRHAPREHQRQPYLIEIRQCLDDDGAQGAPGTALDCARVNRRDQGCGARFRIASR